MNALTITLALVVGVLLGVFYFGGLWLTVRRLPQSATAGLWLLASFVIRTAVVLISFFAISNGQWERIVACLVGFIIARTVMVRLSGLASINGRATFPRSPVLPLASGSAGASPSRYGGHPNGNR